MAISQDQSNVIILEKSRSLIIHCISIVGRYHYHTFHIYWSSPVHDFFLYLTHRLSCQEMLSDCSEVAARLIEYFSAYRFRLLEDPHNLCHF
jgi:hypothetical protein